MNAQSKRQEKRNTKEGRVIVYLIQEKLTEIPQCSHQNIKKWVHATPHNMRLGMKNHPNHLVQGYIEIPQGKEKYWDKKERDQSHQLNYWLDINDFKIWLQVIRVPYLGFILCFTNKLSKECKLIISRVNLLEIPLVIQNT